MFLNTSVRKIKTLSYLSDHLKFCNDYNKLNKTILILWQTDRHEKQLDWLCVTDGQSWETT